VSPHCRRLRARHCILGLDILHPRFKACLYTVFRAIDFPIVDPRPTRRDDCQADYSMAKVRFRTVTCPGQRQSKFKSTAMVWPDSNKKNDEADTELCRVHSAILILGIDTKPYTASQEDMKE